MKRPRLPPDSSGAADQLDSFSAFYFSFTTLSTVGYGDITPATNAAKMLAVLEALSGLFYMAVLISRLVSLHATARRTPALEHAVPLIPALHERTIETSERPGGRDD